MPLGAALTLLMQEMGTLETHLRNLAATKQIKVASDFEVLDECLLEGILSRTWQSWGAFCRSCVVESCVGTVDANGDVVVGLPSALSVEHVSNAAIIAWKDKSVSYWGSTNKVLRQEPTWGDTDVLVRILSRLQPNNAPKMLAAFSASHSSAKALQIIRNASAHNHIQNISEVRALSRSYVVFPITHPIQALFWTEPKSKDFLVTFAMSELRSAAVAAVS